MDHVLVFTATLAVVVFLQRGRKLRTGYGTSIGLMLLALIGSAVPAISESIWFLRYIVAALAVVLGTAGVDVARSLARIRARRSTEAERLAEYE